MTADPPFHRLSGFAMVTETGIVLKLKILPPLLNRAHKVMIYWRVGQPSHRRIK